MATAQNRQQMVKLVSIADARTRRAVAAVAMAQQQLDAARHRLEQRERELVEAEQSVAMAEREIRQEPANEQHRLWLTRCHSTRNAAEFACEEAKMQGEEAMAHLAHAQKMCQRQQARQDHVEGAARRLQQAVMRDIERRTEDDQQGSGNIVPVASVL
jgi:hypothetical protein